MGAFALGILLLGLVLARTLSLRGEEYSWLIVGFPLLVTVATLALFSVLEISIDAQSLNWRFIPFIRKSVPLAEIVEARPTRTSFIYGWGIHYTDRGWLYNVSGLSGPCPDAERKTVHARQRRTCSAGRGNQPQSRSTSAQLEAPRLSRAHDCEPGVVPECRLYLSLG